MEQDVRCASHSVKRADAVLAAVTWTFEQLVEPFPADSYDITEGPVWDGEAVLFTDIPNATIHRYDHGADELTVHRTDTNEANGLKFGPEGHLYACQHAAHRVVRYGADGSETVVADAYDGARLNAPNDLAFDGDGRLWFTDPYYGDTPEELELDHRSVYRVDDPGAAGEPVRVTRDTARPNGILVSPDDERLYVAELDRGEGNDRELRSYPIDGDGRLGDHDVLHNFNPHTGIDGMCLDDDGNIVAAVGREGVGPGPMIWVFAPTGRVLETHPFPGPRPTNCAFAGPDLHTLYVTGIEAGLHRAETDRTGLLGPP